MGPGLEEICCSYDALKSMVPLGWAGRLPQRDMRVKPFPPCCHELPSRCFQEGHLLPAGTLTEEESCQEWSHLPQGDCLLLLTPEARLPCREPPVRPETGRAGPWLCRGSLGSPHMLSTCGRRKRGRRGCGHAWEQLPEGCQVVALQPAENICKEITTIHACVLRWLLQTTGDSQAEVCCMAEGRLSPPAGAHHHGQHHPRQEAQQPQRCVQHSRATVGLPLLQS